MKTKQTARKSVPDKKPKRDPLANAPTSQDIMSGARKRNSGQHTSIPVNQLSSIPAKSKEIIANKPKATFYLNPRVIKSLKRYAVESERTQSQIVETALQEYIEKHPVDSE